jgi:hypothetical protein
VFISQCPATWCTWTCDCVEQQTNGNMAVGFEQGYPCLTKKLKVTTTAQHCTSGMVPDLSLGMELPKVPKIPPEYPGTPVRHVDLHGAIYWTGVCRWIIQGRAENDSGTTVRRASLGVLVGNWLVKCVKDKWTSTDPS